MNGVVWTEVGEGQFDVEQVGAAALVEEFLDVVGFFEVAVSLVAVGMGGDEVVGVIEAEAIGEGLEGEALGGVERGHGTVYKATNWACAGDTKGFSQDHTDYYIPNNIPKKLWLKPLAPNALVLRVRHKES